MTFLSEKECGYCGADLRVQGGKYSRLTGVEDMHMDCVVEWVCPDCGAIEPVQLAEILAMADPAAFDE